MDISVEQSKKIVKQLQYYFGDYNYPRDAYLRQISAKDNGWVPIDFLLRFTRLQALIYGISTSGHQDSILLDALSKYQSDLLELSDDSKRIRRLPSKPLPEWNDELRNKYMSTTVFCMGFPKKTTLDQLLEFFSTYGNLQYVKMHYFHPQSDPTKKRFRGRVSACFETREFAEKFLETTDVKFREKELCRKWLQDHIEEVLRARTLAQQTDSLSLLDQSLAVVDLALILPGSFLKVCGLSEAVTPAELCEELSQSLAVQPLFAFRAQVGDNLLVCLQGANSAIQAIERLGQSELVMRGTPATMEVVPPAEEEMLRPRLGALLSVCTGVVRGMKRSGEGPTADVPEAKRAAPVETSVQEGTFTPVVDSLPSTRAEQSAFSPPPLNS